MKKFICLLVLMIGASFARVANAPLFVSEAIVTCNTSGLVYTIQSGGQLELFAHGKVYITLDQSGVTPNISNSFLAEGERLDTELFYYENQKIGLLADSGIVTVNVIIYDAQNTN